MIDEHRHHYLRSSRGLANNSRGSGLLSNSSALLQTFGKKLLNSAAEKATQKAGEFLGEVSTRGLLKQLQSIVKPGKKKAAVDDALVSELLAY